VDVLARNVRGGSVRDPLRAIEQYAEASGGRRERHPYSSAGPASLIAGLALFRAAMEAEEISFAGDLHANLTLPTAIGSTRVTCLAPLSMAGGDMSRGEPMLIAGFRHFRDFYPPYLAANLQRVAPFAVRHVYLDVPGFDRRHLLPLDIARALDDAPTRRMVGNLIRANLGDGGRVGLPAVLGLDAHREAFAHLQEIVGCPIFEIPTLPPSVPGIRAVQALRRRLQRRGARVEIGFWVRGSISGRRAVEIEVESAGQPTIYTADIFILATGGTGGGGIAAYADGSLRERVFDLSVDGPEPRAAWAGPRFLGPESQPVNLAGVRTNERLQPFTREGETVENVFVTASSLPDWDPVREGSGEGVALATAHRAAGEALKIAGREMTDVRT